MEIILGKWRGYDITYNELIYHIENSLWDKETNIHLTEDAKNYYYYDNYDRSNKILRILNIMKLKKN